MASTTKVGGYHPAAWHAARLRSVSSACKTYAVCLSGPSIYCMSHESSILFPESSAWPIISNECTWQRMIYFERGREKQDASSMS
jgi:hypothetical protein